MAKVSILIYCNPFEELCVFCMQRVVYVRLSPYSLVVVHYDSVRTLAIITSIPCGLVGGAQPNIYGRR